MKISEVRTYVVKQRAPAAYLGQLPDGRDPIADDSYFVRPPWLSLYSSRYETLLVHIATDDGAIAWGEALAPVAPEVPAAIVDRLLAPMLVGRDPLPVRPLWDELRGLMRERGHLVGHQADALAAVDIALWDLRGRALGRPIHDLLGGAYRDTLPVYISGLPRTTDDERAQLAREYAENGFHRFKLALGYGITPDLATVDAVTAIPGDIQVAVDAHWAYRLPDAQRLAAGLEERGAWFLEAPLAPEDIESHRRLAAASKLPIAVGEALRNRYEFRTWLDRRALDIAQPDVGRTGISEALIIGELAEAHHVSVIPHHSVALGVALAAGLQVAASLPNCTMFEYQPTTLPLANAMLKHPLTPINGQIAIPSGPGLGVDVDINTVQAAAEESRR